jgi:2-polyprenyl-6-methoxyphenol hydroxylase-like FAD-dependent oxidoreductase
MAIEDQTKAESPLRILIAGAGIGGLTAAVALGQQGHEVTVRIRRCKLRETIANKKQIFEQSEFANETGAAIHLAPNCNGILRRLGLFAEKIGANDMRGVCRELL